MDDFKFIASFDKIICSNSSYSWWAVFFGNPSAVYTFKRWICGGKQVRLADFTHATSVDGFFSTE
jgi:hypothetical protein